ncbi:putative small lipoprotein YifL, partial [Janthinobacterium sp. CG_23.3]
MNTYTFSALLIAAALAGCGDKAPATASASASAPARPHEAAPAAAPAGGQRPDTTDNTPAKREKNFVTHYPSFPHSEVLGLAPPSGM